MYTDFGVYTPTFVQITTANQAFVSAAHDLRAPWKSECRFSCSTHDAVAADVRRSIASIHIVFVSDKGGQQPAVHLAGLWRWRGKSQLYSAFHHTDQKDLKYVVVLPSTRRFYAFYSEALSCHGCLLFSQLNWPWPKCSLSMLFIIWRGLFIAAV